MVGDDCTRIPNIWDGAPQARKIRGFWLSFLMQKRVLGVFSRLKLSQKQTKLSENISYLAPNFPSGSFKAA